MEGQKSNMSRQIGLFCHTHAQMAKAGYGYSANIFEFVFFVTAFIDLMIYIGAINAKKYQIIWKFCIWLYFSAKTYFKEKS